MGFIKRFYKLDQKYVDQLALASTMGLHMVSGLLVAGGMGYLADRWLETKPWLTLVGLCFGVAAGYRMIYQDLKKLQRHEAQTRENARKGE